MSNPNKIAELEDWKTQNENTFLDWVMDKKFKELEDWSTGHMFFCKDTYESCLEAYIEDQNEELWREFIELNNII